jgi:hypothetical protein
MTAKPQLPQYSAEGDTIWHGKGRAICELMMADTKTSAAMIADMLNYAVANGYKWKSETGKNK